jgi:excisionase family DNA binding protein
MHWELASSGLEGPGDPSTGITELSPSEAARQLGVSRARVYRLVQEGQLDEVGRGERMRITSASIERRLATRQLAGQPLSATSAWAVLALASGDGAFRTHLAARLSDPDRSRARARLLRYPLRELLPRLRGRAVARRFAVGEAALVDLLADPRVVLAGPSAARALGWELPNGGGPLDAYVPQGDLVEVVERYELDPDPGGEVWLRSVPEPWPFPANLRVAPALVTAIDLVDGGVSRELMELGRARLRELVDGLEPSWQRRPDRRRPVRPLVPTGRHPSAIRARGSALDAIWDDRTERDVRGLVALLFVAAAPLRRVELAEALHCSQGRLEQACDVLRGAPPYGLVLVEHADQLRLATAPDVGRLVEAFIDAPPPEPLSQAALEVLAIIAYEQPVSRSDVERIRGIDSSGVIDTLLARRVDRRRHTLWWPRTPGVSGDHRALLADDGYCVAERIATAACIRRSVMVAYAEVNATASDSAVAPRCSSAGGSRTTRITCS